MRSKKIKSLFFFYFMLAVLVCNNRVVAQLSANIDSTNVKIGEEIVLKLTVETEKLVALKFPEKNLFGSLELLKSHNVDTIVKSSKTLFVKKYSLIQFSPGEYTIPKLEVRVNNKVLFTDSIKIKVVGVKTDPNKQNSYSAKPIFKSSKPQKNTNNWILILLASIAAAVGLVIYLRNRRLHAELKEKEEAPPPYELAKRSLFELNKTILIENLNIKLFYSELTLIFRKFLNKTIYNKSLESTSEEIVNELRALEVTGGFKLTEKTLLSLRSAMQRADMVKFAKSLPTAKTLHADLKIFENEIHNINRVLIEAEKERANKSLTENKAPLKNKIIKKQKKLVLGSILAFVSVLLVSVWFFGFEKLKDVIIQNPSKALLDQRWVKSEYGAPGVFLETPVALERKSKKFTGGSTFLGSSHVMFSFEKGNIPLKIILNNSFLDNKASKTNQAKADPLEEMEEYGLNALEKIGVENLLPKRDVFVSASGAKGLKTFGSANFKFPAQPENDAEFIILNFSDSLRLHQLVLLWRANDKYVNKIVERVLSSVEPNKELQND